METVKIQAGLSVKLFVKISTVAIVGSNVSLDDNVIKKSTQYDFTVDLGLIDHIDNKVLSIVTNYFISSGNIDTIMNSTQVSYALKYRNDSKELPHEKVKINNNLFMSYKVIKLVKI